MGAKHSLTLITKLFYHSKLTPIDFTTVNILLVLDKTDVPSNSTVLRSFSSRNLLKPVKCLFDIYSIKTDKNSCSLFLIYPDPKNIN